MFERTEFLINLIIAYRVLFDRTSSNAFSVEKLTSFIPISY